MKKHFIFMMFLLCFLTKTGQSIEIEGMRFEDFIAEMEKDNDFQEQFAERLKLIDINNDGKISNNEITNVADAATDLDKGDYTKELSDMNEELIKAFHDNDKNNDNELTADEIEGFIPKIRYYLLKKSFSTMDRNNDGVYNEDDMPSQEEVEEKLKQSMQKMQETMAKMENMDSDEMAKNWVKSISSAIADEDYYQMDTDHDNCVTREEYVAYKLKEDEDEDKDKNEKDDVIKMTPLEYSRWYIDIKKENKNCLTKEEYIADESDFPSTDITERDPEAEREYAEILFEYMDKDSSGKLTAEEYAEHQYQRDIKISAPKEPILKKETHYDIFLKTMAPDKGWMSKEEFVEDYIKE